MGMRSYVLCIGPYKEKLVRFLDYPADFYGETTKGAMVTSTLVLCETSRQSRELAETLGIHPWDFEKHWIKSPNQINWKALHKLKESRSWDLENIDGLRAFFENKFIILFMPNG